MAEPIIRHIFPGNNTSQGFFSYFASILPLPQAKRFYCLKGGPGVGKSTFLKRIGARMAAEGFDLEYMHCASDPDSLDGLVIPALGAALVDGTAPHITDPVYPAAVDEIINLGDYWDADAIRLHRDEIMRISGQIKRQYRRTYKYIAAAKCLMDDIVDTLAGAASQTGPLLQARHIIDQELSEVPAGGRLGKTRRLFASAITPAGIVHHLQSLADSAAKVYSIKNLWGVGVHTLLERVCAEAVSRGLDVEVYYSPLAPETCIEHLLIPALKLALISEKEGFALQGNQHTVLDMTQYIDPTQTAPQKDAMVFCSDLFHTLLDEAVGSLAQTKALHDDLEEYYIPHMDFARVQQKQDEVFTQLLALAKQPDDAAPEA